MTSYCVQYKLPVENPVSNVSLRRGNGQYIFEVPINHPDAHKMGFMDLLASAELSGLITLSPPHKNKIAKIQRESSNVA